MEKYICPVCGYDGLCEPPYDERGYGTDEICVCCGFQFGYDDYPEKEPAYKKWRENWIQNGYEWFSSKTPPPISWIPKEQLQKLLKH